MLTVAVVAVCLGWILALNHGQFIYTQDDPYIHLALSERLFNFHYGLNPGEYAAPSSSILWPFLLMPTAPFVFHQYVPLVLNLIALSGIVLLLVHVCDRIGIPKWRHGPVYAALLVTIMVLGLNLPGQAMKGMENLFQAMCVAAVLLGLMIHEQERRLPWWCVAALVVGPLLRYESLPFTLGALGLLAYRGRTLVALCVAGALVVFLGGFSLFLHTLDLPPLPSSVLSKSAVARSGPSPGLLPSALQNALGGLGSPFGRPLTAMCLLLGVTVCIKGWRFGAFPWVMLGLFAGATYFAAGKFNARYEIAVLMVAILVPLYIYCIPLERWAQRFRPRYGVAVMVLIAAALIGPHAHLVFAVPLRSNNTFEQQYQMHRFLTQIHQAPVAINDLGLTTYRNPNYVLDLLGLGNEAARVALLKRAPGWMDTLVQEREIPLVMIYERPLFEPYIPQTWTKIATLYRSRPSASPEIGKVAFFATSPEVLPELREKLAAFQAILPAEVRLKIHSVPE